MSLAAELALTAAAVGCAVADVFTAIAFVVELTELATAAGRTTAVAAAVLVTTGAGVEVIIELELFDALLATTMTGAADDGATLDVLMMGLICVAPTLIGAPVVEAILIMVGVGIAVPAPFTCFIVAGADWRM